MRGSLDVECTSSSIAQWVVGVHKPSHRVKVQSLCEPVSDNLKVFACYHSREYTGMAFLDSIRSAVCLIAQMKSNEQLLQPKSLVLRCCQSVSKCRDYSSWKSMVPVLAAIFWHRHCGGWVLVGGLPVCICSEKMWSAIMRTV